MARKRMIDPSFWEDLTMGQLSRDARLCFLGLLSHADDEGRVQVDPRYIKRAVFGFDDDLAAADVACILDELRQRATNLVFYEAGGRHLAAFLNWRRYQYIQKSQKSTLPGPPSNEPLPYQYDTATVPVSNNGIEKNGIEKNGGECARVTPPPPPDGIESRLFNLELQPKQIKTTIAANPKFSIYDAETCELWADANPNKIGILYGSYLKKGLVPPRPRTNGPAPPGKPKQPDLHEAFDEDGNFLYLALPDGTEWKH